MSDFDNTNDWTSDPNSPYWLLICYFLYEETRLQNDKLWGELKDDLTYSNRFFPVKNAISDELKNKSEAATIYLEPQNILYRARIYHDDPYANLMRLYREELGISEDEWEAQKDKYYGQESLFTLKLFLANYDEESYLKDNQDPNAKALCRAIKRWKSSNFKGYDNKESLPPPPEKTPAGRANPQQISYTYLSEDEKTPVYEVRPTIDQYISVAKFKITKRIKLYDLSIIEKPLSEDSFLPTLSQLISEKFSLPYNGNELEYLPTQYLAEYIKTLGFDGLRFNSSLNKGGKNIVLFRNDCYTVMSSKLTQLKKVEFELKDPTPFSILNTNNNEVIQ